MDTINTILVSIASAIIGFFISTWRNRLLPWMAILEFIETKKNGDKVKIENALQLASKNSWRTGELERGEDKLLNVDECLASAKGWIKSHKDAETTINSAISSIKNAKSEDEVISTLLDLLSDTAISSFLELATLRGKISINQTNEDEEKIKFYVNEKFDEGCFVMLFPETYVRFGEKFNEAPHRRDLLLPLVKALTSLNRKNIIDILEKLLPLHKEQTEIHKLIVEECGKLLDKNMRWHCVFMITNFGSTPFILSENAFLCVTGKHIQPFTVKSKLLYQTEEDKKKDTWTESEGFLVIQPGETQKLALVTDTQENIEGGSVLKGVYKSGECNGYIKLQIMGREMPWKIWVKSTLSPFRD